MRHVALGGFDEIRDEVVPALELDVDLRELILVVVAQGDEAIVDADAKAADHEDDAEDDRENEKYGDEHHVIIFPRSLYRYTGVRIDLFCVGGERFRGVQSFVRRCEGRYDCI